MPLKFGKKDPVYKSGQLRYADIRPKSLDTSSLPALKQTSGGGYGQDFTDWFMLGNGPCDDGSITNTKEYAYDGGGDCAWAGPGHEEMESAKNAGRPIPKFTCLNILNQYAEYLGLNGASDLNANNDEGSQVSDVLEWRATKGLLDTDGNVYKIGPFVQLELGDLSELYEALYLFENVGIGIQFPESAMDQFNTGKLWSVVPGAQIEGGHYIPLVGHPSASVWTVVTWGKRQLATPAFITKYVDEAWAYIDPERYNQVTGETLQHYADADLEKYLTLLTQAAKN